MGTHATGEDLAADLGLLGHDAGKPHAGGRMATERLVDASLEVGTEEEMSVSGQPPGGCVSKQAYSP